MLLTTPFLWDNLTSLELEQDYITWLMLIPITDSEFEYLKNEGTGALEELFEDKNIDVFDLDRPSVI